MASPKVWLEDDGIMCIEYPVHSSITLDDLQKSLCLRQSLLSKKHKLLVKLNGLMALSASAQEFLLTEEYSSLTQAVAVVVNPHEGYYQHTKILLGLFQRQGPLPYPLELFDTENEAKDWLHGLVD